MENLEHNFEFQASPVERKDHEIQFWFTMG